MRSYPGVSYILRFNLFTYCSRILATVFLLFMAGCDTQQTLVTIADARHSLLIQVIAVIRLVTCWFLTSHC